MFEGKRGIFSFLSERVTHSMDKKVFLKDLVFPCKNLFSPLLLPSFQTHPLQFSFARAHTCSSTWPPFCGRRDGVLMAKPEEARRFQLISMGTKWPGWKRKLSLAALGVVCCEAKGK